MSLRRLRATFISLNPARTLNAKNDIRPTLRCGYIYAIFSRLRAADLSLFYGSNIGVHGAGRWSSVVVVFVTVESSMSIPCCVVSLCAVTVCNLWRPVDGTAYAKGVAECYLPQTTTIACGRTFVEFTELSH